MRSSRADEWVPPQEFDEYALVRKLGRGAMGQVFLAHDTLLDRPVAIKFMLRHRDAHARERFLVEARAVARLQHPNVVTIHRVGELDEHPYIVTEYVRGRSLDRIDKPVPWQEALDYCVDLARGLAAAHRRGVVHRDIKAANSILAEDGAVKLLDFGLAKLDLDEDAAASWSDSTRSESATASLSDAGVADTFIADDDEATLPPDPDAASSDEHIDLGLLSPALAGGLTTPGAAIGTPYYMAPEVWLGEGATRRSDVYSLGALMYELCTGAPPHHGVRGDELRETIVTTDAAPLASRVDGIDPRFAAIVDRCLTRAPTDRIDSGEAVWHELADLSAERAGAPLPEGNPYRGLLPFEAEHRRLFFGRGREVRNVVDRLRTQPFVLVAGESGVGKSSLCRAGVLPRVADGDLGDDRAWRVNTMVPGRRPAVVLASVLEVDELEDLRRVAIESLGSERGLVVFIDQLEELVTLSDPDEAARFGRAIAELAEHVPGVRVLATIRGDYVTRIAALPGIGAELTRGIYVLRPMEAQQIREVVVQPARAAHLSFESDSIVDELVDAALSSDGALPLLQFTLAELWESRDRERGAITADSLDSLGGVEGALSRHADAVLAGMPAAQRTAARAILLRLVTLEGTRARRAADELLGEGDGASAALESLVRGRLVVTRQADDGTDYEVAHEALLTHWSTLRRWREEQADSRVARSRIASAAADWEQLGRARHALWNRARLAETGAAADGELPRLSAEFIAASRRAARRQWWLRRFAVVAVVALAVGVYGVTRLQAERRLDRKVEAHLDVAATALGAAHDAKARLDELEKRAYQLFDAGEKDAAEKAWSEALALISEVERAYARAAQPFEAALALDSRRASVQAQFADVLYERALLAEKQRRHLQVEELIQRLAVYDHDESRRNRWDAAATVELTLRTAGARLDVERYVDYILEPVELPGVVADSLVLERGSYVIVASAPGHVTARYPVMLDRGEIVSIVIDLPRSDVVPEGFVFVPAGRFVYGARGDEEQRRFYETSPARPKTTGAFLVAQNETTYADWLAYVESLPEHERSAALPGAGAGGLRGSVRVEAVDGRYRLVMQPSQAPITYTVETGEPLAYEKRRVRAEQSWEQMPVGGVTRAQIERYLAWLTQSGRVPNARLCREDEWERAARGADGRPYPHGESLAPADANIDVTYEREPGGFGPDEVGSYPDVQSPFGLLDMAGNAFEATSSLHDVSKTVLRGGAYYFNTASAAAVNRAPIPPDIADPSMGLRVCADVEGR